VRTYGIGLGPDPAPTIIEVIPEGGGDLSARITLLGTGLGSQPMAEVPGFGFRFQTLSRGNFLITVGFGGGPVPGAGYRVSARLDDSPDDITTDDVLDAGASTGGVIERIGDVDVYRVPLTAGATVRFEGDGQFGPDGALNIQLRLRAAEGTLLASDRNSGPGTDARLEFTAAADGDYFLEVAGSGGTTGQYVVLADLI